MFFEPLVAQEFVDALKLGEVTQAAASADRLVRNEALRNSAINNSSSLNEGEVEEAEEEEGRSNGFHPSIRTPLAVISHVQGCVSVMLCLFKG